MIEVTDAQIDEALQDFACTVIGADRELQDARWLEELRAYELTVSNLRTACEAQPERKPLTKSQVKEMLDDGVFYGSVYEIAKAIEEHHGIKEAQ